MHPHSQSSTKAYVKIDFKEADFKFFSINKKIKGDKNCNNSLARLYWV